MKTQSKKRLFLAAGIIGLCAGVYAVWHLAGGNTSTSGARKVRYYQDSMHPWIKSDQPGKCTVCLMDLTPIYEGDPGMAGEQDLIVLSSNNVTVLNVQSVAVERQALHRTVRVAGTLEADGTRKTIIGAPAP